MSGKMSFYKYVNSRTSCRPTKKYVLDLRIFVLRLSIEVTVNFLYLFICPIHFLLIFFMTSQIHLFIRESQKLKKIFLFSRPHRAVVRNLSGLFSTIF